MGLAFDLISDKKGAKAKRDFLDSSPLASYNFSVDLFSPFFWFINSAKSGKTRARRKQKKRKKKSSRMVVALNGRETEPNEERVRDLRRRFYGRKLSEKASFSLLSPLCS
jgi:hypothetical protein